MRLALQVRRYAWPLAAIVALMLVATVVAAYILAHQRLRFPWEDLYRIRAEFTSAQAVTPGQGQNVTVAGVTVGEITRVELRDGRAVVTMDMERDKLPRVHADARMLLRPKTGLNDMSIQLDPGRPPAPALGEDDVLSAERTAPNVNPDEVLAALDADTRDYLSIVVNELGRGLHGRGGALRRVLAASRPTLERTRRITRGLADRRAKLRRLVANLRLLARAAAAKDRDLVRVVDAGNAALGAVADAEQPLRASLTRLPGTLQSARAGLASGRRLARELAPTLEALRPAVRRLRPAMVDLRPLLVTAEPMLRRQLRPLVRELRPLVADLRPAVADLNAVTPALTRAFEVLVYTVNELGHNPPGPDEGYLFYLAWFAHNANSVLSIEDAHGVAWRGQLITSCSTYAAFPEFAPYLQLLVGTPACPEDASR